MWRLLILVLFILQGCSMVTIDELEPIEEQEQPSESEQSPNDSEPHVIEELPVESEEQQETKSFIESLEAFLGLDWTSRKSTNAEPIQYIALGDSLTRGVGDEKMDYGYTARLADVLEAWPQITEVELDNRGKNGRRSDQLLALIERGHYDDELAQADLITMTLGGNDVMRVVKSDVFGLKKEMFDKALPGFTVRYTQIVQELRLRNPDAPLILVGFYNPFHIVTDEYTPFETIIDEWNAEIEQIAETDANACFVPINDLFTSNEDLVYHTDFFHPNGTGYDRMTKRIIETMQACNIEEMSAGRIGFEE